MTHIALNDAQQQLNELIEAVGRGQEFVITLGGKPVAKIVSVRANGDRPRFGSARGKIEMADDFDAPLDDFADYM